jgi:hypothetical protein
MLPELSMSSTASTPAYGCFARLADARETSSTRETRYLKNREKPRRPALYNEVLFMP